MSSSEQKQLKINNDTLNFSFSLSDEEFRKLSKLVYDNFGINLTDAKRALLISRLQGVLKELHLQNFEQYYNYLLADKDGRALSELVNKISTNFTYFYREDKHFEFLINTALPFFVENQKKEAHPDLRIWCAGCSSGEEPYTISILLRHYLGGLYDKCQVGILATDISANALDFASKALYPEDRINKMPPQLKSYLSKEANDLWRVPDHIKKDVTFRRLNLMNKQFPFKNKFHIIFCRNVMIYFDAQTKAELVDRYCDWLVPRGYLFIGHSETLSKDNERLEYVQPAVYRKKG